MIHPAELLPIVRHQFDPRLDRAIGVAVSNVIHEAGGLDALASSLGMYSFHPDFEGVTKSQIAALETLPPSEQAAHVSFASGSVSRHISEMCEQHDISPDHIPRLLDADGASTMIAPTFFRNEGLGRLMLTGHLTVVQLPPLRLVA